MQSHFYAMLSRMKNIYRWGLMRNVKSENLCEHTLETAYIANALAIIGNRRLSKNYDVNLITVAAMFHDTSEIITGDMPTPIKYLNSEIKTAYKEIEKNAEQKLIDLLPYDMQSDVAKYYELDADAKILIKAADKISALIKCIEETNMGNREFSSAQKSTKKAIKALNCPEADIFIDEFIDSYSLTLDELK